MSELTNIIAADTVAGTALLRVRQKRAMITCDDLDAEVITVQVLAGSYVDLFKDGEPQRLSATNNALYLPAPGDYRVEKPITVGNIGVYALQD